MTLGQFFLGLVTLAVATLAYRWQKTIDRETTFHVELREQLVSFRRSTEQLYGCYSTLAEERTPAEVMSIEDRIDRELSYLALFVPEELFERANVVSSVLVDLEYAESRDEKKIVQRKYTAALRNFEKLVREQHLQHLRPWKTVDKIQAEIRRKFKMK